MANLIGCSIEIQNLQLVKKFLHITAEYSLQLLLFSVLIKGINYGFQVMESAESPNIPFTNFRTRFAKGNILEIIRGSVS